MLGAAPDGTLYAYSAVSELEQTATGLLEQRWVLCVNLGDGSTEILSVTPDGERTLFAENVVWDQMSVEVDGEGDMYFTSPEGIYRIYREP